MSTSSTTSIAPRPTAAMPQVSTSPPSPFSISPVNQNLIFYNCTKPAAEEVRQKRGLVGTACRNNTFVRAGGSYDDEGSGSYSNYFLEGCNATVVPVLGNSGEANASRYEKLISGGFLLTWYGRRRQVNFTKINLRPSYRENDERTREQRHEGPCGRRWQALHRAGEAVCSSTAATARVWWWRDLARCALRTSALWRRWQQTRGGHARARGALPRRRAQGTGPRPAQGGSHHKLRL
ncbi:hypothetical protein SEVIR_5G092700v4 [Setaria viridis]|uniref:Uncharacterized protein n=1 Tax=Setaria viridis TaxID=4556 RepID=A0A4U6UBK8_SETVI|nr:hypothetical protein SEVIR_5G092700v2 [Setaria viridis]